MNDDGLNDLIEGVCAGTKPIGVIEYDKILEMAMESLKAEGKIEDKKDYICGLNNISGNFVVYEYDKKMEEVIPHPVKLYTPEPNPFIEVTEGCYRKKQDKKKDYIEVAVAIDNGCYRLLEENDEGMIELDVK